MIRNLPSMTKLSVRFRVTGVFLLLAQVFFICKWSYYTLSSQINFEFYFVTAPPVVSEFRLSKNPAVIGDSVAITCVADGVPAPKYTILHNDTDVVSNTNTYTMNKVNGSHAGTYKCIAKNKFGSYASTEYLTVTKGKKNVLSLPGVCDWANNSSLTRWFGNSPEIQ